MLKPGAPWRRLGNILPMLPSLLGARSRGWGENQEGEAPGASSEGWSKGWVRGPRGGGGPPAPTQGRISYASQGPTWGWETSLGAPARVHGALANPFQPQHLPGDPCHPPQALISDCCDDAGIFNHLGETICLLDDKRLLPHWGGPSHQNTLAVVGETLRSRQAA